MERGSAVDAVWVVEYTLKSFFWEDDGNALQVGMPCSTGSRRGTTGALAAEYLCERECREDDGANERRADSGIVFGPCGKKT